MFGGNLFSNRQIGATTPNLKQQVATAAASSSATPSTDFETTRAKVEATILTMKRSLAAIGCELVYYGNSDGFHMHIHTAHENGRGQQRMLMGLDLSKQTRPDGQVVGISVIPRPAEENGLLKSAPEVVFKPDGTPEHGSLVDLKTYVLAQIRYSIGPDRVEELSNKVSLPDKASSSPDNQMS